MSAFGIDIIQQFLSHRPPFLFVDEVLECDGKGFIVGQRRVDASEYFFQGHFPGNPVMPGVLQIETMAQTAGLLAIQLARAKGLSIFPSLTSVNRAKFRRIVRPGDVLRIEATLLQHRTLTGKFYAKIFVDGKVASEAELSCILVKNDTHQSL